MYVSKLKSYLPTKMTLSLKNRLFLIIIFEIMLFLLFMSAFIFTVTNNIFNKYSTVTDQLSSSITSQLNFQIKKMEEISELSSIIINGSYSDLNKELNRSDEWTPAMSQLVKDEFQSFMNSNTFIDTLCVYNASGNGAFLQQNIFSVYECEADTNSNWFSSILSSEGEVLYFTNAPTKDTGISKRTLNGKIYTSISSGITRAIRNPLTSTNIGAISLTINTSDILSQFMVDKLYENQQIVLFLNHDLLTASEDAYIEDVISHTRHKSFSFLSGRPYIINHHHDNLFDCWIYTPLYEVFNNSFLLLAIILINILLFSMVIASVSATIKSIVHPLNTLTIACQQFSIDSHMSLNVDDAPNEFKPLFSTFNEMYLKLHKLINDIYIKDIEQKNLEIQFLRSQINPHYLYNTLECLHLMAYTDKCYDVALMAELLGKNLQYGLRTQTQEVTLKTEIEKVREYVRLISFSYQDLISVQYGIDPKVLSALTLRLIIQPIIENTYIHGISGQCSKLSIEILGYCEGDKLILKIHDDGIGIPSEKLKKLQMQLSSAAPSDSIGLNNVNRRIKLFYGKPYGLQVDSQQGQGTLVTIILPFHEKAQKEYPL